MSRSQYTEQTTTTSTTPGMARNYSNQDYNSSNSSNANTQYRGNSNYNRDTDYDDARHHGRWTASGESRDLTDTSSVNRSDRHRDRDNNRDRDYDRNDRNRDFDRNDRNRDFGNRSPMSGSGYQSGYDSSYGQQYGPQQQSSFGSHPGMSGSSFGSHPGMSGYGMPYESQYGSGSYSAIPHPSMGSGMSNFPASFPHYGQSTYGMPQQSSYGMPHHYGMSQSSYGMPQHYGMSQSSYGMPQQGSRSLSSRSLNRGSTGGQTPECDIYEVGNDYIIELDLPGHSRDHIDTKLYGNELVITSKPPRRSHNFHMNERGLGHSDVNRKLYLPQDAHTGNINASLTNGVLKIVIPRNAMTTPTSTSGSSAPSTVILAVPASSSNQQSQQQQQQQPQTTLIKDTTTTTTETKRI